PARCSGAWSPTGCSTARRWSCTRSPRLRAHDDLEGPGAVDALDPVELDAAGRAGAADPGLGPGGVEAGGGRGDASPPPGGRAHDQVVVGDQAEHPSALPGAGV